MKLKLVGIILIVMSLVSFGLGINKMLVYHNSDYASLRKNVYVGGDAYNYIINANYFTGFSVLGGCLFLSGVLLIATDAIIGTIKPKAIGESTEQ